MGSRGVVLEGLGGPGGPWGLQRTSGVSRNAWHVFGTFWRCAVASWGGLGTSCRVLGSSWAVRGVGSLGVVGGVMGRTWVVLGGFGGILWGGCPEGVLKS